MNTSWFLKVATACCLVFAMTGCPWLVPQAPELDVDVVVYDNVVNVAVNDDDAQQVTITLLRDYNGDLVPIGQEATSARGRHQRVTATVTTTVENGYPVLSYSGYYYQWYPAYGYYGPVPYNYVNSRIVDTTETTVVDIVIPDGSPLLATFYLVEPAIYVAQVNGTNTDGEVFAQYEYNFEFVGIPELDVVYVPQAGDSFDTQVFGYVSGINTSDYGVATWIGNINGDNQFWSKPNVRSFATIDSQTGLFYQNIITATQANGAGLDEFAQIIVVAVYQTGSLVDNCQPCTGLPNLSGAVTYDIILRDVVPIPDGGEGEGEGEYSLTVPVLPPISDPDGFVQGFVTGPSLGNYRVAAYTFFGGVWNQKEDCEQLIAINPSNGSFHFSVSPFNYLPNDFLATHVAIYVVPAGTFTPCTVFPTGSTDGLSAPPNIPSAVAFGVFARPPAIDDGGEGEGEGENPELDFTQVSILRDPNGTVSGVATGANPATQGIAVYILVDGVWWEKEDCNVLVPINPDGTWTADITIHPNDSNATHVVAYLVPYGQADSLSCTIFTSRKSVLAPEISFALAQTEVVNRVPTINIVSSPGPADPNGILYGHVAAFNGPTAYKVVVYIRVGPWWSKPNIGSERYIFPDENGFWEAVIYSAPSDRDLTEIVAGLIPIDGEAPECNPCSTLDRSIFLASANIVRTPSDGETPVITVLGQNPLTLEGDTNAQYSDAGANASDVEDGDITSSITTTGSVNLGVVGNYVITYTVVDSDGNTAMATRTVHVVDTTPPVITILGPNPHTVQVLSGPYPEAGATALDAVDGDVSDDIQTVSTVNTELVGTYSVTYTVFDAAGNAAQAIKTVHVVNTQDNTPPVLAIQGDNPLTVEVNSGGYVDPGATAVDDVDGDISDQILTESTVDMTEVGTYTVTYTVNDSSGNGAQGVRTVHVVDTTPPVVTPLVPDFVMSQLLQLEHDLAAYRTDNSFPQGTVLWSAVYNTGALSISFDEELMTINSLGVAGDFTVTLTVMDESGNMDSQDITVTVLPCDDPIIFVESPPLSGSGDTMISGSFCGGNPADYRVVVYIKVTFGGVSFWFVKPDFGANAATVINPDGSWETTFAPNDGVIAPEPEQFLVMLIPVSAVDQIEMCGQNPPTCADRDPDLSIAVDYHFIN